MSLQKFVTDVIEALGGVVIPVEYALCQAIVPEEYRELFQGRTELELAFDFEVAEENPQAEFVTFGSYLFEQIVALANTKAVSTLRFAEVDRLSLANPLEKIGRFLEGEPGKIRLLDERAVIGVWAVFRFKMHFVSEEKEEECREVWVDLTSGEVCEDMRRNRDAIAYRNEPLYTYPIASKVSVGTAFKEAYRHVRAEAEARAKERMRSAELSREIRRIEDYYADLANEMRKRSERKGLSEQKKEEYMSKLASIEREKQKQLREMENKYNVQTEIALDHGMLYFVPQLEYIVEISFRNAMKRAMLHYNPVLKQFSRASGEEEPVRV